MPLIVAPAAANDITGANFNEYTFRTSRNNYQDFINLCQYLTTQYDTFVQIAPDYSFGYGGAASARDACTKFGGEFVADDIFAPLDTTDFTPYVEQMPNSGAEAWIATWAGGGFVPLMQAAQDLGLTGHHGHGIVHRQQRHRAGLLCHGRGPKQRHSVPLHGAGQSDQRLVGGAGEGALQRAA